MPRSSANPLLDLRMLVLCALLGAVAGFAIASRAEAADCADSTVGLTPLNDLGAGFYKGFQGGLYPGGSNARPAAHDAAGIALASAVVPLDTLGSPSPTGRIVFISIGMSNTTQEFSTFVDSALADPLRNPRVQVLDCAQGGQTACLIADPSAPYWASVLARIHNAGARPAQVQVVWLKEACRVDELIAGAPDSFPGGADLLRAKEASIVRNLKDLFPNAKLVFLSGRTYGGYATTNLNPEPWAYENSFGVKWLIEEQIAGVDSLNFDPDSGAVEAPWLAWGPYLWADGLIPRSDGFVWRCEDVREDDGTHPSLLGRAKVAHLLKGFCHTDPAATPWYLRGASDIPAGPAGVGSHLSFSPNPFSSRIAIRYEFEGFAQPSRLEIFDTSGRRVREYEYGPWIACACRLFLDETWDGLDGEGRAVPAGIYLLRLETDLGPITSKLTLVR